MDDRRADLDKAIAAMRSVGVSLTEAAAALTAASQAFLLARDAHVDRIVANRQVRRG